MSEGRPSALGAVARFFRFACGLSADKAARIVGMKAATLSELERGEEGTLSRDAQEELLANFDIPPEAIDFALFAHDLAFSPEPAGSPVDPTPAERRSIERAAVGVAKATLETTREKLAANLRQAKAALHRRQAAGLWNTLQELPPRRRRLVVETERKYWTWALAERLSEESGRAAAHRADEAVELARVALRVAELAPGSEPWRSGLLGWVWAFVANSLRVQGDLPGSEDGFLRSDRLLEAGAPAFLGVLDASRPLDLKASLRRYQGHFDEALALLEQALKVNDSNETRGRILIKKANTLELMGDSEGAVTELRQAKLLLEGSQEIRTPWIARHTLAVNLWQLGRYAEAEALLPEVRKGAIEMGNELDLIRTLWLEGGVAAGLGRREQAFAALEQVRRYFNVNRIAYDTALASLELAVLYLEERRTAEVERLSREMYWIFKAQGVPQEALAALRLFCEAATKQDATADSARQLIKYLTKARCNPDLRFEAC